MLTAKNDCDVINGLIKVTIDSADGYRKAADDAANPVFQQMFHARADERDVLVDRMQAFVSEAGGEATDDGSLAAGAHRIFLGLREIVSASDDDAIIAEVERGEDYIKERFEKAHAHDDLSDEARSLIAEGQTVVTAGHDQISALKHQRAAATSGQ